jgi:type I restriction enzyme, S subunit
MMPKPGYRDSKLGEIPLEWEVYNLGQLAKFINGASFNASKWVLDGLPIIRIQNLNGSNEFNYFEGEIDNRFKVKKGDLLFAWSGSRGTSFGAHIWNGVDGVLNQHIFRVEPKDVVQSDYLCQKLKYLTKKIEKKAHGGAGLVHVTKSELERYELCIPPLLEQQKIASILSSIDTTLERSWGVLEQVEEVRRAVMQELMTRGEVTTLGELAAKNGMQTGPFGGQLHAYEYTETGIPVVMPQDLTLARILERKIARVPQAIADRLERHKLQLNDIVFSRRGNLGRFGLVGELEVGWLCGTGCLRFRPGSSVDSGYLIRFLQRQETIDWLHGNAVGQTMPNLNTAILSELPIVIPDITEQKRISGVFDSLDKRIRTEQSKISQLERIKQDLMHLLLTGQKRVNV